MPRPGRHQTTRAKFLRSQIAARAAPIRLPTLREWQFRGDALPRARAADSRRSRWRSAEQTRPRRAASTKPAARLRPLPPAAENSRSYDSSDGSYASSARVFRRNSERAKRALPALLLRKRPASGDPAGSSCGRLGFPDSQDLIVKRSRVALALARLAETESPSA